ncbi:MAG: protease inhibitor I42 family protein [Pseudomonadota bacterium]
MKRGLAALGLSAFFVAGCAQDVLNTQPEVRGLEGAAALQTLTDPSSGTDVNMRVGGQVRIELDANATTGYMWQITKQDETALKLVSSDYLSDAVPEGLVGAGGMRVFVFEAITAKNSDLELTYQRSPQDVADTLRLRIKMFD